MGSIEISRTALATIALVSGLWLALALVLVVRALRRGSAATAALAGQRKSRALLDAGPQVPAVVHDDMTIEAGQRLADLIGLPAPPPAFDGLCGGQIGLSQRDLDALAIRVRETAGSGGTFSLPLRPQG